MTFEDAMRVGTEAGELAFDGSTVWITRRWWPDRGTVEFRVGDIRAVHWREARKWLAGHVQFVVPGASDQKPPGNYWTKAGNDTSYRFRVTYTIEQERDLRALCDLIAEACGVAGGDGLGR